MKNPETSPYSLELDNFWPYQIVVLADLISRQTHQLLKHHSELNLSQWRVLAAVGDRPGRSAAEVVKVTPMDKGIVSRGVTFLLEHGYLNRVPSADDKRRAALYLTEKGQTAFTEISEIQQDTIRKLKTKALSDRAFTQAVKDRITRIQET